MKTSSQLARSSDSTSLLDALGVPVGSREFPRREQDVTEPRRGARQATCTFYRFPSSSPTGLHT